MKEDFIWNHTLEGPSFTRSNIFDQGYHQETKTVTLSDDKTSLQIDYNYLHLENNQTYTYRNVNTDNNYKNKAIYTIYIIGKFLTVVNRYDNWFCQFPISTTASMSLIYEQLKNDEVVSLSIQDTDRLMIHFSMDFYCEYGSSLEYVHYMISYDKKDKEPLLSCELLSGYKYEECRQIIEIPGGELRRMEPIYKRLLEFKQYDGGSLIIKNVLDAMHLMSLLNNHDRTSNIIKSNIIKAFTNGISFDTKDPKIQLVIKELCDAYPDAVVLLKDIKKTAIESLINACKDYFDKLSPEAKAIIEKRVEDFLPNEKDFDKIEETKEKKEIKSKVDQGEKPEVETKTQIKGEAKEKEEIKQGLPWVLICILVICGLMALCYYVFIKEATRMNTKI